jgi:hypothetical protein
MAKDPFEEMDRLQEKLHVKIQESIVKIQDEHEKNEWLRHLHTRYSERFLKDNDRIWAIGNIFIPISLAGLVYLPNATIYTVVPLGLASMAVIFFWIMFAENHRAFQNYHISVVKAIEKTVGLDIKGGKVGGLKIIDNFSVQRLRWFMFYFVVIVWISAIILVVVKHLIETP